MQKKKKRKKEESYRKKTHLLNNTILPGKRPSMTILASEICKFARIRWSAFWTCFMIHTYKILDQPLDNKLQLLWEEYGKSEIFVKTPTTQTFCNSKNSQRLHGVRITQS